MSFLLPTWPRPTSHQLLGKTYEVLIKRRCIRRPKPRHSTENKREKQAMAAMGHHGSSWVMGVEEAASESAICWGRILRRAKAPWQQSVARLLSSPLANTWKYYKILLFWCLQTNVNRILLRPEFVDLLFCLSHFLHVCAIPKPGSGPGLNEVSRTIGADWAVRVYGGHHEKSWIDKNAVGVMLDWQLYNIYLYNIIIYYIIIENNTWWIMMIWHVLMQVWQVASQFGGVTLWDQRSF
jgi:hypothetical protein